MNTSLYLFIIVIGVLQAMGNAMNAPLYRPALAKSAPRSRLAA